MLIIALLFLIKQLKGIGSPQNSTRFMYYALMVLSRLP